MLSISFNVNFFLMKRERVPFGIIVSSSPSPYPKPLLPVCQLLSLKSIFFQLPGVWLSGIRYLNSSPQLINVLNTLELPLSLPEAHTRRYSSGSIEISGKVHFSGLSSLSETVQFFSDIDWFP